VVQRSDLTPAMEDYLKAAYLQRERHGEVTVLALAQALAVASPSVTGMIKRLAGLGLLCHERYGEIALTPAGEAVALETVRHHRLLELYLTEALGMSWEEVHAEADRLEHHISEALEERIAERLGQPEHDPHGDPIPARDLTLPARHMVPLNELTPGAAATVARIADQQPGLLHYVGTLGLVPGAPVRVVAIAPYGGVITVAVGQAGAATHAIGGEVAARILVTPLASPLHEPPCLPIEPPVGAPLEGAT